MVHELSDLFERDLLLLRDELNNFKDEKNMWRKADGIANSAGNLTLHLAGSISYNIGTILGNTGYVRNREQEFTATDISRAVLVDEIEAVAAMVKKTLPALSAEKLTAIFPFDKYGRESTAFYLLHFYGHLNYHLGQVNYLRRILEG